MTEPAQPPLVASRDAGPVLVLALWGLTDGPSASRARMVLESVPGVGDVHVDLEEARATVRLAKADVTEQILIDALTAAGYGARMPAPDVTDLGDKGWARLRGRLGRLRLRWPGRRGLRRVAVSALLILILLPPLWVAAYGLLPVPITPLMMGRWLEGASMDRSWASLDAVSPALVDAVIAAEDSKFCGHGGFDWEAIDSALAAHGNGNSLRGASTISMQTAKNAFLWPERSWLRKGVEAYFTLLIETLWSKRRIMTVYLNVAEWGPGIYGAEAAARFYFKKSALALTRREASLLAAVLPNPREWKANPPGPYVQSRSATLLGRMHSVAAQGLSACVRN